MTIHFPRDTTNSTPSSFRYREDEAPQVEWGGGINGEWTAPDAFTINCDGPWWLATKLKAEYKSRLEITTNTTHFVQTEESQFFDDRHGAHFWGRGNLAGNLQTNCDNLQRIGKHHLGWKWKKQTSDVQSMSRNKYLMYANLWAASAGPSNHFTIEGDLTFRCKFIANQIICLGNMKIESK